MEKHITVTTYVIQDGKVLLLPHAKIGKWLPPGGHLEANELPTEGAQREVKEETGLSITFIRQENVWIERWNAQSFERPYMCLVENIPKHGSVEAHQHIDLIYLAEPNAGTLIPPARWFSLEEVEKLTSDEEIFEETKQTLRVILS